MMATSTVSGWDHQVPLASATRPNSSAWPTIRPSLQEDAYCRKHRHLEFALSSHLGSQGMHPIRFTYTERFITGQL